MQESGHPVPSFEFRPRRAYRLIGAASLIFLWLSHSWWAFRIMLGGHHLARWRPVFLVVTAVVLALLLLVILKTRIFFDPRGIHWDYGITRTTVRREDIVGWWTSRLLTYFELRDRPEYPISIAGTVQDYPQLRDWIRGLPEFDAMEAVLQSGEGTRNERREALARAQRFAAGANVASILFAVWFLVTGNGIPAIALILIPFGAFALNTHPSGFIRFARNHPSGMLAVFVTPAVLAVRSATMMTSVNVTELLFPVAFLAVVFVVAAAKSTSLFKGCRYLIPGFLLLSVLYGYGATVQLNTQADHSRPATYQRQVVRKDLRRTEKNVRYLLRLTPWADRGGNRSIEVSEQLWHRLQVGESVCIPVHAGALGVAWYHESRITACKP